MSGAVITGAFVMASIGAFYLLWGKFVEHGRIFVKVGVIAALYRQHASSCSRPATARAAWWPLHQPATLAAMEALFQSQPGAPLVIIGQPNVSSGRSTIPSWFPNMLSLLTYRRWGAHVQGLNAFPQDEWPDNIPLLYYSYHIMVGLGTIFIAIMVVAALLLWRGKLYRRQVDALDPDAQPPIPVHRQHRGMDDGRTRPPAVARVWADAHR